VGSSIADDVILNKAASIEGCLKRIEDEYAGNDQIPENAGNELICGD
jgi:hypothetical protein